MMFSGVQRRVLWALAGLPWLVVFTPQSTPPKIDFAREIAPVLKSKCGDCHGADLQSGGLRLDTLEGIRKGGTSGKLYQPFKSSDSQIVRRLLGQDGKPRMPMGFAPLPDETIAKIKAWIDQGAVLIDPSKVKHWAYLPPVRPALPIVKSKWAHNPIDLFVQARLQKEGLSPSVEATKETLARRAALDLTGLPPTIEELDALLADKTPGAYERYVDGLLASPHYGERMARIWMDLARYADTNGYEKDLPRQMWAWRDWVINAFNKGMPYDRFTIEQLAGDLLPNASRDDLVATGFHRNSMLNDEGGIDPEEFRVIAVMDRIDTTATTWLGSTLACAQCHNHKYDPFTQKDYYSFFAFFNRSQDNGRDTDPVLRLPSSEQAKQAKMLEDQMLAARLELAKLAPAASGHMAEWERAVREGWTVARPSEVKSGPQGAVLTVLPDASVLASGPDPKADLYTITIPLGDPQSQPPPLDGEGRGGVTARELAPMESPNFEMGGLRLPPPSLPRQGGGVGSAWFGGSVENQPISSHKPQATNHSLSGLRIEAIPDPVLPEGSSGRNFNGNFVLRRVEAVIRHASGKETPVRFKSARADFSQQDFDPQSVLSDTRGLGWAIAGFEPGNRVLHTLVLSLDNPMSIEPGDQLVVVLGHQTRYPNHNLGRFRISLTSDATLASQTPPTAAQWKIFAKAAEQRTKEEGKQIEDYLQGMAAGMGELRAKIAKLKMERDAIISKEPTVMVMSDLPKPRPDHILKRGDFRTPGDPVSPATPVCLGDPAPRPDRLGLAEWLVDPKNPLTARVEVNRLWEQCFGRGLVATPEDFGSQGDPPSHPELLDWLATEFMARKWDIKVMLRLIVTSATYRQSSKDRLVAVAGRQVASDKLQVASGESQATAIQTTNHKPQTTPLFQRDPYNILLARGPRFRVEAETVRDIALTASGLLTRNIGGPSVMPPQPPGIWENSFSFYDTKERWLDAVGPNRYRRGLYTYWRRTAPYPMELTFDLKSRDMCVAHRSRTNSPLQALNTLNDPVFFECAGRLGVASGLRAQGAGGSGSGITYGFRAATSRKPSASEIAALDRVRLAALDSFRKDPPSATKLLKAAGITKKEELTVDNAAWIVVANTILNLDETITKG